jgi:hypothetical protein
MKYVEGMSEASVKGKGLVGAVNANAQFGVLSDNFLKEVCFALKADRFHPFERVPSFEVMIQPRQRRSRLAQNLM